MSFRSGTKLLVFTMEIICYEKKIVFYGKERTTNMLYNIFVVRISEGFKMIRNKTGTPVQGGDFFNMEKEVYILKGLSEKEMIGMLQNLATISDKPKVTELLEKDPGRFRAFHVLTGGNPGTIVLLFNVLCQGNVNDNIRNDLEGLFDSCTPLYKARFEAMPAQSQQIVDGLAINWNPASAAELASKLHMDTHETSATHLPEKLRFRV